MAHMKSTDGGLHEFSAQYVYHSSGERGLSVRVLPNHPLLSNQFQPRLITWASV
jgi:starch phosphorylase